MSEIMDVMDSLHTIVIPSYRSVVPMVDESLKWIRGLW